MNWDKEKEVMERLFDGMSEGDCKDIIAMGTQQYTKFYTMADPQTVHQCMMDVAKRLAWLPPSQADIVEGHHLVTAGEVAGAVADRLSSKVFMELPPSAQNIAIVLHDDGDSVFCVGEPSMLAYIALRTCISIEQANTNLFDGGMN